MIFFLFLQKRSAIPEAGYITLGTIRYGVKLSTHNKRIGCYRASTISSQMDGVSIVSSSNLSTNGATATTLNGHNATNGHEPNGKGIADGCSSCKNCCCLNGSALTLPWKTNSQQKNSIEMSKRNGKNSGINSNSSGMWKTFVNTRILLLFVLQIIELLESRFLVY